MMSIAGNLRRRQSREAGGLAQVFSEKEKGAIKRKAELAKAVLLNNVRAFPPHRIPLLVAGEAYPGIWLEHNLDNLHLADFNPESAWASQQVFMDYQREDGLLPFMLRLAPDSPDASPACYWHVQSVYPFAACALNLALKLGKGEETLARIYAAAARYDEWFVKFRDRSGNGLVEMYCEWDTGHDNDPRVVDGGIPHTCPGCEARNMPDLPMMPILSVDLSATLYGGRVALGELARRLGKTKEEALWLEKAQEVSARIKRLLYDPEDDFYYDRDRFGFRKYRGEHITRLFLNHVLPQDEFERIFARYFKSAEEFWPACPIPSMSVSDKSFVKSCPRNCWGANSQALTMLRAFVWLEGYGKHSELLELMGIWLRAFLDHDNNFSQELNPFTGAPVGDGSNYTPSAIAFLRAAQALT